MQRSTTAREYWNKNVAEWGKYYLQAWRIQETFDAPRWLKVPYGAFISPLEARLMMKRFHITMDFIRRNVFEGMVVVDVGCGTGIFTVELLKRGAIVKAVDFAQTAIDLTMSNVKENVPKLQGRAEYLLMDVTQERPPCSDLAIAMGVTPYVEDLSRFYYNILATTSMFYCLILDSRHWANLIRKKIPALNVRHMNSFERSFVDSLLERHGWRLLDRQDFGSGFIDTAVRSR